MRKKNIDFSKMKVFDFSSIDDNASSTNNCFGCDSCDNMGHDYDWADPSDIHSDPAYNTQKQEPIKTDKFENASEKELLKSIATSLEKIATILANEPGPRTW